MLFFLKHTPILSLLASLLAVYSLALADPGEAINPSESNQAFVASDDVQTTLSAIRDARFRGDMKQADALAIALLGKLESDSTRTDLNNEEVSSIGALRYEMGRNAMERNNYELASHELNIAIELLAKQSNSPQTRKLHADALRQLGLTYRYQSNYDRALPLVLQAKEIYQALGDKRAIAGAYNSIGVIREKQGLLEQASEAHLKALRLNQELGSDDGVASALYNLGDIRSAMGDHETALTYFYDALKIDEALEDPKYIAYDHNKIAGTYLKLAQFDKALMHVDIALDLFDQIQAPRDYHWALTNRADILARLERVDQATQDLDKVIALSQENQWLSLLVDAYRSRSKLALEEQNWEAASRYASLGLEQARQNKELQDIANFQQLAAQAYREQQNYEKAFYALSEQLQIELDMFNQARLQNISSLQAETEAMRQAQQVKMLEQEQVMQALAHEQAQLNRTLIFVAIGSSAVLFFLLWSRYSQARLNQRLAKEVAERTSSLALKNQELKNAYETMKQLSYTDSLTGVKNRHFFHEQIAADINQSLRLHRDIASGKKAADTEADIVFFMLDIDHFKAVNDTYGHQAGDAVLKEVVSRMRNVFRQSDYLIRWGGEEFLASARFIHRKHAQDIAQRLLDELKFKAFELNNGTKLSLTCSVGYACYPPCPNQPAEQSESGEWENIVNLADLCLYKAKQSGRDAWCGVNASSGQIKVNAQTTIAQIQTWKMQGMLDLAQSFA
uniref:tetratricopeptide repeat-containing diguanylate cyclase n=1 Tax=Ningiella ruwaisensis TaxID=2364274 RepID=UPI0014486E00|nr:diguanylate cyclase [Ningiella ruwaisensis]